MGYKRETVEVLSQFRKNMGSDFYQEDAKRIFRSTLLNLPAFEPNPISEKKLQFAHTYIKNLLVLNFVKFIGVTGSVSGNIAKEEDDIDFFVVVKNNTLWIYRGLLALKNLFNSRFRKADSHDTKDLICLNLIAEERGLVFDNDLFNLNELYFIKPIYNEEYYEKILAANQWLKEWGGVISREDTNLKKVNVILEAFNLYFFLPQLLYMFVSKHRPEVKRLLFNYVRGRIEFFPSNYKSEKLAKIQSV